MNVIQDRDDRDDYPYKCSICGLLYNRDEIILEHELSPICDFCLEDHEKLDAEGEPDFDLMRDFRKEVKKLQKLERRNHDFT